MYCPTSGFVKSLFLQTIFYAQRQVGSCKYQFYIGNRNTWRKWTCIITFNRYRSCYIIWDNLFKIGWLQSSHCHHRHIGKLYPIHYIAAKIKNNEKVGWKPEGVIQHFCGWNCVNIIIYRLPISSFSFDEIYFICGGFTTVDRL